MGSMFAARRMSADPDNQQIPPLRCASVGMTSSMFYGVDKLFYLYSIL